MMVISSSNLRNLSSAELDRRARAEIDGLCGELRGAGAHLEARCSPLELVKRHPMLAASLAAAAGLVVAQVVKGGGRAPASASELRPAPASVGRAFGGSLLASLASAGGRALPGLILKLISLYR